MDATNTTKTTAPKAKKVFYAVEFLFVDGRREISRIFSTKRAATKWAHYFSRLAETRVMMGGAGGIEVMRFRMSLDQPVSR